MRDIRPTANIVKQAIFNILQNLKGKKILDLFAGTGQIGITALEKGAESVVFVEIEKERIKDILKKIKNKENIKTYSIDVLKFLKNQKDDQWDIIFADPPYNYKLYDKLIKEGFRVLKEGGLLIVEHSDKTKVDNILSDYIIDSRKYGDTLITFWRK